MRPPSLAAPVLLPLLAAGIGAWAPGRSAPAPPGGEVDFRADVWPILEANCIRCHGPEKAKSGLRLDREALALAGGYRGPALVPGDAPASLLLRAVTGEDFDGDRMPLEEDPLPAAEIETLRRWIAAGARWTDAAGTESGERDGAAPAAPDHWAYVAPERPRPPAVSDPSWTRSPLDAFVLARLDAEGLAPSDPAERTEWIRRVTLDLVGLPPELDDVDAYLADDSPDADARVVDRLLASPHFGERWAQTWLDLARYADTNGYSRDFRRTMWRYRDWVIDALNDGMPFDRFTIEQVAGDLLPDATDDQLIASGFHRNSMKNSEAGVDPEEDRVMQVADRVSTTGTVFLGTTLGCAQCHDHKYDPFSQEDFYSLAAFFDSGRDPTVPFPTDEDLQEQADIEAELATLDDRRARRRDELAASGPGDVLPVPTVAWSTARPVRASAERGAELRMLTDGSFLALGPAEPGDTYTVEVELPAGSVTGLLLEVLPDPLFPGDGPGRGESGLVTVNRLSAALVADGGEPVPLAPAGAVADRDLPGHRAEQLVAGVDLGWGVARDALPGVDPTAETDPDAPPEANRRPARPACAVLAFGDPVDVPAGARLAVELQTGKYLPGTNLGRFRIAVTGDPDPRRERPMPPVVTDLLEDPERGAANAGLVASYLADFDEAALAIDRREVDLLERRGDVTTALVMGERETPRETRVLLGGNFQNPGKHVTARVPEVLPPLGGEGPHDRLDLARWLVSRENPLTARVTVNRIWERLFGRGLVLTSEDFGTQGDPPSHPGLLDWLAVDFVESGWDLKRLVRTLALSATYRQSSRVTPELLERDPENVLLARGPRYRVEAETIRDVALAASGLLAREIGGPSVFPPQPAGTWTMIDNNDEWITDEGPDRYRRGLYTFWRRTAPYPSFTLFDAPSREVCLSRRSRSNTPLQALVTLNDPAFVEAARALARRMIEEGGATDRARLEHGFRLCVTRRPSDEEAEVLLALLEGERARFAAEPERALALLGVGRTEEDAGAEPDGAAAAGRAGAPTAPVGHASLAEADGDEPGDPTGEAAWTLVANVLLNLDETITKE